MGCKNRSPRAGALVIAVAAQMGASVAAAQTLVASLTDLSLEELSNIEITSVSRRAERLSDAPTSVFVITADDIRRSGATSLPEALRLAPNLQVARASANEWAISARGFNSASANKLLVLIDGRSVYSPLFSGVFWDVQDLMLEDVERIEVISGPGGTLWGLNAVNGIVNVITRPAGETQGSLVAAGIGNREAQAAVRHGGTLGADGHYRVYAKQSGRAHTENADGTAVDDKSHTTQLGFRADWGRSADRFTLQGDAYTGRREQPLPGTIAISGVNLDLGTIEVSGANLIAHWERRLANDGRLTAHASVDHIERVVPPTFTDRLDIVDLQVQHASRPTRGQSLVWGAEYRYAMDHVKNSIYVAFLPARLNQAWGSLFAQDEITLPADLQLTLGARVEHNGYTGSEFLPNVRLAWKPAPNQLLWTAVSRTVRAPSRLDRDTFAPGQPPYLLAGGNDFRSEIAKVFELGYRAQPSERVSFSITAFHADYDHLRTQELAASQTSVFYGNGMRGRVRGVEGWGTFQASPRWRLHAGFNRLWQDFEFEPGSIDTANSLVAAEGANPAHQAMLRSSLDLPHQTELDITARHVARLGSPYVPAYTAVDARLAWRPREALELSIAGQNLFASGHGEFTDRATRTQFDRAVFVELVSRF
jgi:iron complex outermembrane receptor protein